MTKRMRKSAQPALTLLAVAVASTFVACPLLTKKTDDAGDGTPDGATVTVSGTGAKNEASVLRYANETPLGNLPAMIGKDGTVARNFPGNGPTVATLAKGTAVAKVAQYFSTGTLIMFDDPSGDGSKLLGWVRPESFDTAAPPPARTVVVPPRPVDGGAASHDAGPAPHADAGGGGHTPIPQPPPGTVATPPTDGKCPDGWTLTQGMCRRNCAKDADCPRGTKCLSKGGAKVCSSG
jgi:hypothetical protein